jgi:hypothetical protein
MKKVTFLWFGNPMLLMSLKTCTIFHLLQFLPQKSFFGFHSLKRKYQLVIFHLPFSKEEQVLAISPLWKAPSLGGVFSKEKFFAPEKKAHS